MPTFDFDTNLSPAENIEAFIVFAAASDPELADLLRSALRELTPLAEAGLKRDRARQTVNRKTAVALDRFAKAKDTGQ